MPEMWWGMEELRKSSVKQSLLVGLTVIFVISLTCTVYMCCQFVVVCLSVRLLHCVQFDFLFVIHHFHIDHNAPCLPSKILHNYCFQYLLGITVVPRKIKDSGYAKFWGVNKVHFGLCENGE